MSVRLKIGSLILDTAETASTSTIAGCRLLFQGGPRLEWAWGPEGDEIPFLVQVKRDTPANLKTALKDLKDALKRTVNADVVLEYSAGNELNSWKVSNNDYQRISAKATVKQGSKAALVLVTIMAETVAGEGGGAGDFPGSLGPVRWLFMPDPNGRPMLSTTVTFKTYTDARAFVAEMRATPPSFIADKYRMLSPVYDFEQQPNSGDPPGAVQYTPCNVSIAFRALPEALSGAAFNDVVDVDYDVNIAPRQPTQEEAGATPGFNITITGAIQVKGEKDATFDPGDTDSVAPGAIPALVRAALASIKADAQTRLGKQCTELDEPEVRPSGTSGQISFVITGVTELPGGVMSWEESVVIERISQDKIADGVKGKQVFPHADGPLYKCYHTLSITALTLQAYRPLPFIDDTNWHEDRAPISKPKVLPSNNGTRLYVQTWQGEWTRVGPGVPSTTQDYAELAGAL